MDLETFLKNFNYKTRKEMKISAKQLVEALKEGKALLVDIRFKEEYKAWNVQPSINIPLNELPQKYQTLPKDKLIVTACPHKDRAIIAMTFLRSKGIPAKYLVDGLTGLVEVLRGDTAKEFADKLNL